MTSRTSTDSGRGGVTTARALSALCLALGSLLTYLAPTPAAAQWTTLSETFGGETTPRDTAHVRNPAGHSLGIHRDSHGIVRGTFSLNADAAPLDERSCPTFRVDSQPPRALTELDGPCEVEGRTARFTLGVISDGVVESAMLTQLMNGTRILVWYHLKDRGYHETEFTLRRSMQALMGAMGGQVQVQPE